MNAGYERGEQAARRFAEKHHEPQLSVFSLKSGVTSNETAPVDMPDCMAVICRMVGMPKRPPQSNGSLQGAD